MKSLHRLALAAAALLIVAAATPTTAAAEVKLDCHANYLDCRAFCFLWDSACEAVCGNGFEHCFCNQNPTNC